MYLSTRMAALALAACVAYGAPAATTFHSHAPRPTASVVPDVKHYFSFGASFTQTLFNENDTQPSAGNPMGNPTEQKTYTGGQNYVDFLTTKYNSSLVFNYNFARGGATTSRSVVGTGPDSTTFEEQVHNHFLPHYSGSKKKWHSDNAFFSMHFGINDITLPLNNDFRVALSRFTQIPNLLNHYFSYLEDLYAVGARRFLVINVPPQDRTPMILGKNETVQKVFQEYIIEYNAELLNRAQAFTQKHKDAHAAYFDVNAFMSNVLDDPKGWGFPDATCIDARGQKCVWFNNFHPGERFHDKWSEHMKVAMDALGYNGSKPASGYFK